MMRREGIFAQTSFSGGNNRFQFCLIMCNKTNRAIFLTQDMYVLCCAYRTNKLGFTPEFLGRVKLVTSIASLLGVGLYNGYLKNVPLRKIFLATTLTGTALGLTQVCIQFLFFPPKIHNLLSSVTFPNTITSLFKLNQYTFFIHGLMKVGFALWILH